MTADTKTYCFGRFLIDLPKEAEVNGQSYEFMFGKIESERFLKGEEAFAQKMKEREDALRTGKHENGYSFNGVRNPMPNARVFKIEKKLTVIKGTNYGFDAYLLNKGLLFSMKETAFDEDGIDSVLQRLETRLLPNLRYRRPGEIPAEPGFCVENGFIADDGKTPQHEYAELNFKFKQWPDVIVSVSSTRSQKIHPSLLERVHSKPLPAEFVEVAKEVKTFREGKHDVGPLKGEEILEALPTDQGFFIHRFVWDTQGKSNSAIEPAFYFELQTGVAGAQDTRPSLSDTQAIELFDTIVDSIRLRPTTPGKASAMDINPGPSSDSDTVPRLPLGTQVSSLRSCPESGVYVCAPDALGVAQRELFIERGRPMPAAFAHQAARGIAGLLGAQQPKEVETLWTLVAYQQGD